MDAVFSSRAFRLGGWVLATFIVTTAPIPVLLTEPASELHHLIALYLLLWSIAIPTFLSLFGLYRIRGDMREAIAGSFVVAFLVILIEAVILNLGEQENTSGSIRSAALTNFMTLFGTIVVFYFGSEAAIRVGSDYLEGKRLSAEAHGEAEDPSDHDQGVARD